MELVNIISVVVSPLIAVLVSMWIQDRKERQQHKREILGTLIGARHNPLAIENIRALNVIDLVFYDEPHVRSLWREYFGMLCNEELNNQDGWELQNRKRNDLITAMAASLGYGRAITHLDMDRVYIPVGLADTAVNSTE